MSETRPFTPLVPNPGEPDPRAEPPTSGHGADPTRSGAMWVTATGALLVFAAAVVFVAVRWAEIPDGVKLGTLGALSGGLIVAGRTIRTTPITARVLYVLGAFLAPVAGAAVLVHLDVPWETGLGVGGLLAAVGLWGLARLEPGAGARPSPLDAGALALVAASTVGLGALVGLPAPLLLAGAAVATLVGGQRSAAAVWAVAAGVAPVLGSIGPLADSPSWRALDQAIMTPTLPAASAGALVALVLLVIAHQRRSTAAIAAALAAPMLSLSPAVASSDPSGLALLTALASVFLVAEGVALVARADDFWAGPTALIGAVTEVAARIVLIPAAIWTLAYGVFLPNSSTPAPGPALFLAAAGWLLADVRRTPPSEDWNWHTPGWPRAAALAVLSVAGAVVVVASPIVAAVALLAMAGAGGLAARPGMVTSSLVLLAAVPIIVIDRPGLAASVGLIGALVGSETSIGRPVDRRTAWRLWADATLPVVPLLVGATALAGRVEPYVLAPATVLVLTGLAGRLDLPSASRPATVAVPTPGGWVARTAGLGVLAVVAMSAPAAATAATAAAVLTVSLAEAARLRSAALLLGAVPSVPLLVGAGLLAIGWSEPDMGLALVVVAILVGVGTATVAPADLGGRTDDSVMGWSLPGWLVAGTSLTYGVLFTTVEPHRLGQALLLTGIAAAAVGAIRRSTVPTFIGSGVATIGSWTLLDAEGVTALDAYAAPVGVGLLLNGLVAGRATTSSWTRFGSGAALLLIAPLAERLGGAGGTHAVVAGATAMIAVAAGAWWRQAAPLILGTLTLVVLVGHESLAVTAGLPTWVWLASGGAVLIGAGLAMERAEQSPLETGRRLSEAMAERFV